MAIVRKFQKRDLKTTHGDEIKVVSIRFYWEHTATLHFKGEKISLWSGEQYDRDECYIGAEVLTLNDVEKRDPAFAQWMRQRKIAKALLLPHSRGHLMGRLVGCRNVRVRKGYIRVRAVN